MKRPEMLALAGQPDKTWDIIIIGGGATGTGAALDAASRGYSCLLLEQSDFGKGTSSRSTKLVHGGVRYLEQGNISLVMEALKERGILKNNAPHHVSELAFVVPNYDWWEMPFYGVGLKIYDLLSIRYRFGKSQILSKEETIERLPTINQEGLRGGVLYFDGQFDDTRLLIDLAQTAHLNGATLLNYARVFELNFNSEGMIDGVSFSDEESGLIYEARGKAIINATGAFCDEIRKFADPDAAKIISPSQGIHIVLDKSFLPSDHAIMIPHTSDGRVMFAIPWHGFTLVGTTDTPIEKLSLEPKPLEEEIDFILETAGKYLHKAPMKEDILSTFAGIRPLVKAGSGSNTAALSRDHTIEINHAGLITITGGKWTTYRRMAEDAINKASIIGKLTEKECITKDLKIFSPPETSGEKLHEKFEYYIEDIIYAIRNEMAQNIEDILARRTRCLFLDAKASIETAPKIAKIMAEELGKDEEWQQEQIKRFNALAKTYLA